MAQLNVDALDAVERNQSFFAEGLMYLCHPFVDEIVNLLKWGEIGEVKAVSALYVAAISPNYEITYGVGVCQ